MGQTHPKKSADEKAASDKQAGEDAFAMHSGEQPDVGYFKFHSSGI